MARVKYLNYNNQSRKPRNNPTTYFFKDSKVLVVCNKIMTMLVKRIRNWWINIKKLSKIKKKRLFLLKVNVKHQRMIWSKDGNKNLISFKDLLMNYKEQLVNKNKNMRLKFKNWRVNVKTCKLIHWIKITS